MSSVKSLRKITAAPHIVKTSGLQLGRENGLCLKRSVCISSLECVHGVMTDSCRVQHYYDGVLWCCKWICFKKRSLERVIQFLPLVKNASSVLLVSDDCKKEHTVQFFKAKLFNVKFIPLPPSSPIQEQSHAYGNDWVWTSCKLCWEKWIKQLVCQENSTIKCMISLQICLKTFREEIGIWWNIFTLYLA